jgi:hypothetical protein
MKQPAPAPKLVRVKDEDGHFVKLSNGKFKRRRQSIEQWIRGLEDYRFAFKNWVHAVRAHSTKWAKEKVGKKFQLRANLTAEEYERYLPLEQWNAKNRRVFHIEPVTDRDGAVREVLKYLTKAAQFVDTDEAVIMFSAATRGVRMVQTFGSWYGFDVESEFDAEHLDDWHTPQCSCGLNMWESVGVLRRPDVAMLKDGRWVPKRHDQQRCRGVPLRSTEARGSPEREIDQHGS